MDTKEIRSLREKFKFLENKIKSYSHIVVYRHSSPDFDAYGSQMGIVTWIKDNFKDKDVHFVGEALADLVPSFFPYPEKLPEEWYHQKHLAITCDISDFPRLDGKEHLQYAAEVIKIDHHPRSETGKDFGTFQIVYPDRPAASELIALFALSRSRKYVLSKQAATYLFIGLVGDTGRFMYQDCDGATFRIAADLLDTGVDKTAIYNKMYETDERRLGILRYLLSNYRITPKGTCYYVLTQEALDTLKMSVDEGNLFINTFRNVKGVKVIASITFDKERGHYRVSLRSLGVHLASVAALFDGGGHDFAAGCKLMTLDELPRLLDACDAL